MLDIRLIREKPDFVRERLATRGGDDATKIDEVLAVDAQERHELTELQNLNAERNRLSKEIGALRAQKKSSEALEDEARSLNDNIAMRELMLKGDSEATLTFKRRKMLLEIPNLPHDSVPLGKDPSGN